MRPEFGLGRFGDRRLEKGGLRCMPPWLRDPAVVFGGWEAAGPRRCGFGAFCIMAP
jgi:hypothetical protein